MATSPRAETAKGILLPEDASGKRSSTSFATSVLADALRVATTADAQAVLAEADWRRRYPRHFVKLVEWSVADPEWALSIARRGLQSIHDSLEFGRDGEVRLLADAMAGPLDRGFEPVTVAGTSSSDPELIVPYRGDMLRGPALRRQTSKWVNDDIATPSFASAIDELLDHPEWLDLSDQTIVLLGAGAEVGPIEPLTQWRANLVAVDLPGQDRWRRLRQLAESGNGQLTMPCRDGEFGADLTTDAPEIAAFVDQFDGPLCIGGHAYADGRAHLLVSAAMDAIESHVSARRGDVSLTHLLTPSDTYAVPERVAARAQKRWESRSFTLQLLQAPVRAVTGGRAFRPQLTEVHTGKDGFRAAIVDSLVTQQGPNYALAKRVQQWRSLVARADGRRVSANIAPSTRTRSVTSNRALALAYRGASAFRIEVFEPETANVLMAALLARDLRTLTGPADPGVALTNPLELFQESALHGGLWTSPYVARSGLPFAAVAGLSPF